MHRWGTMKGWLRVAIVAAVFLDFLTPEGGLLQAQAQSGAACPIGAPVTVTTTTYALTNNNTCQALIFTAASPVTVTAPAANTVAPGYQVMLFSVSGGITLTSSASTINSTSNGVLIGGGQSGLLYGDGSVYWYGNGSGFSSTPPNSAFTGLNSLPGVTSGNSGTVVVPNAIMQFTNPASFLQGGYPFAVCGAAPPAFGSGASGTPRSTSTPSNWLQIMDPFQKLRLIPLCSPSP